MILATEGFRVFPADAQMRAWARAAKILAKEQLNAEHQQRWWRHQKTWFVGVDALPNEPDGSVDGVALSGAAIDALGSTTPRHWHPAQLSVITPGYPGQDADESDPAHWFRRYRYAAHIDGLLPVGPDRARMMKEPPAFILGIGLNDCGARASPLVVWPRSQIRIAKMFEDEVAKFPGRHLSDIDVTETYASTRRAIMASIEPIVVPLRQGEAVLLHPKLLHGTVPWRHGAMASQRARLVAFFRPATSVSNWLEGPA